MPRIPNAEADANFVLTGTGGIVEIQGTAEKAPFSEEQFSALLGLARQGTARLFEIAARRRCRLMPRLAPGSRLVLASHNRGKLAEIEALLRALRRSRWSPPARSACPSPRRPSPISSAMPGSRRWPPPGPRTCRRSPTIPASASPALGGAPGVVSARWAGPGKDFAAAMDRVHRELGDNPDRRAWFISTLCLAWPDGTTASYVGRIDGTLTWPPRGARGFGYDPIFVPAGERETYGEMDPGRKARTSHRARAFAQLVAGCLRG